MTSTRPALCLVALLCLSACGDGAHATSDADPGVDTPPDGPCGARTSTPDDPVFAALLDWLEQEMATKNIPGAAVAVIKDGAIAHVGLLGVKERGACAPITEDTRLRLTPITQLFTAAAIVAASDEGTLDLGAPITDYVPGFTVASGDPSTVTTSQLLTFTSGWPAFFETACPDLSLEGWFADHTDVPLWFPAGTMYEWSNYSSSLAGLVLEKVTGQTFDAAVKQRILDPLGLSATYDLAEVQAGDHAEGHNAIVGTVTQVSCPILHPTGSLYASVKDVANVARMLLRGGDGVLSAAGAQSMLSAQSFGFAPTWGATHGLKEIPYGDVKLYSLAGWGYGFSAEIDLIPERNFGFVVLLNRHAADPSAVSMKAMELIEHLPPYAWGVNTTDPASWSEYVGTYVDPIGVGGGARTVEIAFDGTKLTATMAGTTVDLSTSYPGVEHGPDVFTFAYLGKPVTVRFWRDGNSAPWAIGSEYGAFGPPAFRQ